MASQKPKNAKNKPIERIYMCDKCNSYLWTLKILSHYSDGTVGATEWVSHHPLVYAGGPKDFECPICHKPWAELHYNPKTKQEARRVKVVNPETGNWTREWM